jgi:hypothetical protein
MKQLLVLALTAIMVLTFSTIAFAGSASVDYMVGTFDWYGGAGDEATAVGFTLDIPFGSFKIAADYLGGTLEPGSLESCSYDLRFAYLVHGGDGLDFYLGLGYARHISPSDNYFAGSIISADLNFTISDVSTFDVMLGVSISGTAEGNDDSSILIANLLYSYYFSDAVGMRIGYHYYAATVDFPGDPNFDLSGLSVGIAFRF